MTQRADRPRPWLDHYDYWVPAHTNYPRRSLYEILRRSAAESPELPATTFLGADLTFGEIKDRADRLATALARHGIVKGDRVGIMLPNCPQYVFAVFAVLRLGATVVNINPAYTAPEVAFILRDSGVRMVLTLDALAPSLAHAETRLRSRNDRHHLARRVLARGDAAGGNQPARSASPI